MLNVGEAAKPRSREAAKPLRTQKSIRITISSSCIYFSMKEIEVSERLSFEGPIFCLLSILSAPLPNSYTNPIVMTTKKIKTIINP